MTHLVEMKRFIMLTEADTLPDFDDEILEDISSELERDQAHPLIESLSDVVFKLNSYREMDGAEDYRLGVEEGLALAARMLVTLIETHTGKSR
jgi:hypothetical protein